MKNGYKIDWTKKSLQSVDLTFEYLKENWTKKEVKKFAREIERTTTLISQNPYFFQKTNNIRIRRSVILKLNAIFYHVDEKKKTVTIISFFNNRKRPWI